MWIEHRPSKPNVAGSNPAGCALLFYGERSSVGRAPGCGSGGRGFDPHRSPYIYAIRICNRADMAKLVDALDLGSSRFFYGSSSLPIRTVFTSTPL